MAESLTIALDAMGGDHAPGIVVEGAELARRRHADVRFRLFGDEAAIAPLLARHAELARVAEIAHTPDRVTNDDKPSVALRAGRKSSMRLAIDAVAAGEAGCVVSAGNTGALMAMAKFALKTLPGVDRPAIAAFLPTLRGTTSMLDLGANVECTPENLVQFAVMGAVFHRAVLGVERPTIGLMNVGAEDLKGHEAVRAAAAELRDLELPGRFHGFVEGDDLARGTVDVIVTDGFTGNVALKTAEGTAKLYAEFLRQTFKSSLAAKIGYLMARPAFKRLKDRTDPRKYNGALFLGLRGVCVKSHGGTDAVGFANAIDVAVNLVRRGFNETVKSEFQRMHSKSAPDAGEKATA